MTNPNNKNLTNESKEEELKRLENKAFLERVDLKRISELRIDLGITKSGYTGKRRNQSYRYKKKLRERC